MRQVKRTAVLQTTISETREHRVELEEGEEEPDFKAMTTNELTVWLSDREDVDEWDTVWESDEELYTEHRDPRVVEEVVDDGRSEADARYDRDEDSIREEMASGERDERGRRVERD